MADCLFCKIIAGDIPSDNVYQDDKLVVFKDIHPKARIHLLVVPRIHINSLIETESQHAALLAHMLMVMPGIAKAQGLNNGFRVVINTGAGGGQIIDHLHFHLMGGGLAQF